MDEARPKFSFEISLLWKFSNDSHKAEGDLPLKLPTSPLLPAHPVLVIPRADLSSSSHPQTQITSLCLSPQPLIHLGSSSPGSHPTLSLEFSGGVGQPCKLCGTPSPSGAPLPLGSVCSSFLTDGFAPTLHLPAVPTSSSSTSLLLVPFHSLTTPGEAG